MDSFSKGGAEQDYIVELFSFQCPKCHKHVGPNVWKCPTDCAKWKSDKDVMQIGSLDAGYKFQIHQMGLTRSQARKGSPLDKLIFNLSGVSIVHMSARPKPSHLILGQVNSHQEPLWACIPDDDFVWYNDDFVGDAREKEFK